MGLFLFLYRDTADHTADHNFGGCERIINESPEKADGPKRTTRAWTGESVPVVTVIKIVSESCVVVSTECTLTVLTDLYRL